MLGFPYHFTHAPSFEQIKLISISRTVLFTINIGKLFFWRHTFFFVCLLWRVAVFDMTLTNSFLTKSLNPCFWRHPFKLTGNLLSFEQVSLQRNRLQQETFSVHGRGLTRNPCHVEGRRDNLPSACKTKSSRILQLSFLHPGSWSLSENGYVERRRQRVSGAWF